MPQVSELTDADYPNIWAADASSSDSGTLSGEKSFFFFSIQAGNQDRATNLRARVSASVGDSQTDTLSLYVWSGSSWVLIKSAVSTAGTAVDFNGRLDFDVVYISDSGVTYLLLTTDTPDKTILLNYAWLEFDNGAPDGIQLTRKMRATSYRKKPTGLFSDLSSEWLMGVQLKPYHTSDSSLWKPDAYSDYFPFVNRCHFYSPEIANDNQLLWQTSYGQRAAGLHGGVLSPESPSALNYAPLQFGWDGGLNTINSVNQVLCNDGDEECETFRRNFYKSCRIYEPDPEIESTEVLLEGGTEVLKLTFKTRFHHGESAPGAIARDVATWDKSALRLEAGTYRTTENALREYLLQQSDGTNAIASGPGNNGANSTIQSNPDNPFGTVYPTFYFVRLIPSPYEDGNDRQDPTDTPVTHDAFIQMELYLRAMCEGYVDGKTTTEYACAHTTSSLYDFTFEALCLQAFGNRWFNLLPLSKRPDNAQGFGPLPNTQLYADTFNQFASAVNLLTRVRVMLPMTLEAWFGTGSASKKVTAFRSDGTVNADCGAGDCAIYADAIPPEATVDYGVENWKEVGEIVASVHSFIDAPCVEGGWGVTTVRQSAKIRWRPNDPDSLLALPEEIRGMLNTNTALLARVTTIHTVLGRELTDLEGSAHCCLISSEPCPGWWNAGDGKYWAFPPTGPSTVTHTCEMMPSEFSSPSLPMSTHARGHTPGMGDDACTPGPVNSSSVKPIVTFGALIEVPLV